MEIRSRLAQSEAIFGSAGPALYAELVVALGPELAAEEFDGFVHGAAQDKRGTGDDEVDAARARLKKLLQDEGKLPPEPLSPAQNVALTGYGMSFGQSPKLAGGLAAAGNLLSDPRGAYRQAHDTNQQYMGTAFAQNPEAARNQTRFGGAVATAATLGKIAGPAAPVTGPRGLPGTLKWGAEGAALGEGGLSGAGGTLRWGGLAPLTAASLTANRLPQQVPPGTAQLPPPDPRYNAPAMPQDATRVAPQARQNPGMGLPGMGQGLSQFAQDWLLRPETQDALAYRAELERRADMQSQRMGGPGPNVVGSSTPGLIAPTATDMLGQGALMVAENLPVLGDLIALAEVGIDVFHGNWDIGTTLALASVIPGVPHVGRALKNVKRADKLKALDGHRVLEDVISRNRKIIARADRLGFDEGEVRQAMDIEKRLAENAAARAKKTKLPHKVTPEEKALLQRMDRTHPGDVTWSQIKQAEGLRAAEQATGTPLTNNQIDRAFRDRAKGLTPEQQESLRAFSERANANEAELRRAGEWQEWYIQRGNNDVRVSQPLSDKVGRHRDAGSVKGGDPPPPPPSPDPAAGAEYGAKAQPDYLPHDLRGAPTINRAPRGQRIDPEPFPRYSPEQGRPLDLDPGAQVRREGSQFEMPDEYRNRLEALRRDAGGADAGATPRDAPGRDRSRLGSGRDDSGKYPASTMDAPRTRGYDPTDLPPTKATTDVLRREAAESARSMRTPTPAELQAMERRARRQMEEFRRRSRGLLD